MDDGLPDLISAKQWRWRDIHVAGKWTVQVCEELWVGSRTGNEVWIVAEPNEEMDDPYRVVPRPSKKKKAT